MRTLRKSQTPNTHHRAKSPSSQRTIPLLVPDYCHVRDGKDEELATILVARLYPSKTLLADDCDQKGIDDYVFTRLAAFVKDTGCTKVVYKSDQDISVRAMSEHAFRRSGRHGVCYNPQLKQFIPEASAVGESQSNGKAESSVLRIEDFIRTYKSALESRIGF